MVAKKKAVARKAQTALAEVPDYIKNATGAGRGSEEVGAEDLIIPRVEIIQALSPARKKTDAAYIEGAEEGMLFNTLTRELYGERIAVVPVAFHKEWIVWKTRKAGGGFRGAFPSAAEARARAQELIDEGEDVEVVDTGQHIVLVVHDDGRTEEAVISMQKSKAKVSRQWNSLIRLNGGDRFSRQYEMTTFEDENSQGDTYFNYRVALEGFPSQQVYAAAEALYESIHSGKLKVGIDRSVDGDDEEIDEDF